MIHDQAFLASLCTDAPMTEAHPLKLPRLLGASRYPSHYGEAPIPGQAGKPLSALKQRSDSASQDPEIPVSACGHASAGEALPSGQVPANLQPGGSIRSAAISDVLECRADQVRKWGHTPESDRARPIRAFVVDVGQLAIRAREDEQFDVGLPHLRRRLVKLAALALAAIDRIDMEPIGDAAGQHGSGE